MYISGHQARQRVEYTVEDRGYDTPCWIWALSLNHKGYGSSGREYAKYRTPLAHRVYYQRYVGPIPEGFTIDHLCRNRACVNPDHLEAVTHVENVHRGSNTKLTASDVAEIRARFDALPRGGGGRVPRGSLPKIAADFGITADYVGELGRRESWKSED